MKRTFEMAEVHGKSAYKMAMKSVRALEKILKNLVKINKILSN